MSPVGIGTGGGGGGGGSGGGGGGVVVLCGVRGGSGGGGGGGIWPSLSPSGLQGPKHSQGGFGWLHLSHPGPLEPLGDPQSSARAVGIEMNHKRFTSCTAKTRYIFVFIHTYNHTLK